MSANLFSTISSVTGAQLFKGFDRRAFRAFSAVVKLVFADDHDGRLIASVVAPHSAAVSC